MSKFERFKTEYLADAIEVSLKTFIRAKEDQYMHKHNDKCYQFPGKRIDRFIDEVFAGDGVGKGGLYDPHLLSECWAGSTANNGEALFYQETGKQIWCVEIQEHQKALSAFNSALCNQKGIKKSIKQLKKSYKVLKQCINDDEYTTSPLTL